MSNPNIGKVLRNRREELGLSQHEVAARVGMSRAYLTRLEGGHHSPTMETVERLARALKTSLKALLAA